MRKLFIATALSLAALAIYGQTINVQNNNEFELTLSQNNYNRLLMKQDKILDFTFPENALAIKKDEQDGSVYLMPTTAQPFTLFLTTERGEHFTVTVHGEESLGKTIELIKNQPMVAKASIKKPQQALTKQVSATEIPSHIVSFLDHMSQNKPVDGVQIQAVHNQTKYGEKGLVLKPKAIWKLADLKGEIIEVYNRSNQPLALSKEWFIDNQVAGLKFSQNTLMPKSSGFVYRVYGEVNG